MEQQPILHDNDGEIGKNSKTNDPTADFTAKHLVPLSKKKDLVEEILTACKLLSISLNSWSTGERKEDQISELYTSLIETTNKFLQQSPHDKDLQARISKASGHLKKLLESVLSEEEDDDADVVDDDDVHNIVAEESKNAKNHAKRAFLWDTHKQEFSLLMDEWTCSVKSLKPEIGIRNVTNRRVSYPEQALKVEMTSISRTQLENGSNSSGNLIATPGEVASDRASTPITLMANGGPQSPWDKQLLKDFSHKTTGGFINNQSNSTKSIDCNLNELFLQIGDVTKKVSFEGVLSFNTLQLLFVEKFHYNNGLDVFPLILIREIGSETREPLFYELENLEDVKEGSVLKLRTPSDSKEFIIHNIQLGFSTLAKELLGIKKVLHAQKHGSNQTDNHSGGSVSSLKLSQAVDQIRKSVSKSLTGIVGSPQAALDFKVRGILDDLRQIRSSVSQIRKITLNQGEDFAKTIDDLRVKVQNFKASNMLSLSHARVELNSRKAEIAVSSESIATRMKDLHEIVEEMRIDVTQRKCNPGETKMSVAISEALAIQQGIMGLREIVDECKPSWKKTWESELQSIVAEQQFLKERIKGLDEMEDDHEGLMQVLQSIKQVIELQGKTGTRKISNFSVPVPDENHEGLSTILQEISSVEANSSQRMEAIARSERLRQREKEFKEDPFSRELKTFIDQDKLNKTGGIDEIERLREKKNRQILTSLLNAK